MTKCSSDHASAGAGAPGSISEDRLAVPAPAGKAKLAAERDVVGDPFLYVVKKAIELRRSYHPLTNYLAGGNYLNT